MDRPLNLLESVLLLGLDEKKGSRASGASWMKLGLGGAVLAELLLAERIRLVESKMGRLERFFNKDGASDVEVVSSSPLGSPVLDEALETIATSKKVRRASSWVSRLGGMTRLADRVAEPLCAASVLSVQKRSFLFFRWSHYPTVDPRPEEKIRRQLEDIAFHNAPIHEVRVAVLLSVAYASGLLAAAFDRKRVKQHKTSIELRVDGDPVGRAVKSAVAAAQAAAATAASTGVVAGT